MGSRIAVIDTGADLDHQSFDADAFAYSLAQLDGEYDLLDAEEITGVLDKLNAQGSAEELYVNAKIPFGFNYVDSNLVIDHDHEEQGGHGSHVAGIATANAYVPDGEGGYQPALEHVKVQGIAPDAQLIVMKVFGANGGAYDSDYMAAIEDAILLGADSVNLSLGSGNPGFTNSRAYQEILDMLSTTDTVVTMSAGNAYGWANNTTFGYLFADDVSMQTSGTPGTNTNSLSVASVDNIGITGYLMYVGEHTLAYADTAGNGYPNAPIITIAGEHEFVFFDNCGVDADGNNLLLPYADEIAGKVVFVSCGESSFYQKHDAAAEAGAVACIVYNNHSGSINMDLSDSTDTIPCVSITQADGAKVRAAASAVEADGTVAYYTGKLTIGGSVDVTTFDSQYYTISEFSSWGVPGSLELKPEITDPGGNIYSIDGEVDGGEAYIAQSGTSMAAPQAAGMAALVAQYIRENGLDEQEGISARTLAQSLLMSTAEPIFEAESGGQYYPVLRQGSGLANVGKAVSSETYLLMNADATDSYADGKVKVELGDDPDRAGSYQFSFTVNNLTDEVQRYTMSADFFTQDLFESENEIFMDTWTALLNANTTFTVDGAVLAVESWVNADVDGDGDTDTDDVQAILNYAAGVNDGSAYDLIAADVDADGQVDTYDAYLLLKGFDSASFEVPASGSVAVVVDVALTDDCKAYLDANYTNGAYVEGFVYVDAVSSDEGVEGVSHSIPVLGFYGNWSDASMFDRIDFADTFYNDPAAIGSYSYLSVDSGNQHSNSLTIRYPDDSHFYDYTFNPYSPLEDTVPTERAALSSDSELFQQRFTLIRNASALASFAMDQDGNVLNIWEIRDQALSAFYYHNASRWMNTRYTFNVYDGDVSSFGLEEGDVLTYGMVAVPEYYETNGEITEEELASLISSGKLGDGAFLTTDFTIDNTAPELVGVSKDLTTGDLIIKAQDRNYIAAVYVMNKSGYKVYDMGLPEQTAANEVTEYVAKIGDANVGEYCTVMLADYAGNESFYQVEYGGEPEDFSGRMFGFTATDEYRAQGPRWMEIVPEELYYETTDNQGGFYEYAAADVYVVAAEYVDGYVFFASEDGCLYAAEHDDLIAYSKVGDYFGYTNDELIMDMAYNYVDEQLYAIDRNNRIYTIDTITGEMVLQYELEADGEDLQNLAIDGVGNFYSANNASGSSIFLYTWTKDDVDAETKTVTPASKQIGQSGMYNRGNSSMAWNHVNDVLCFACAWGSYPSFDVDNELWYVNVENGTVSKPNDDLNGQFQAQIVGLYIVPSTGGFNGGEGHVTHVEIDSEDLTLPEGTVYQISADVFPWNAIDKNVNWYSSDESIATVKNGVITTIGVGQTTIRAVSTANPDASDSITLTVEELPNIAFSGLIYDPDGNTVWADFETDNLTEWTEIAEGGAYYGGTLHDRELIVHDTNTVYGVDPDSFKVTPYGSIASSWLWSDAAEAPETEGGYFGNIIAPCYGGQFLEMINVAEGALSYFDLSEYFASDTMAVIAFAGSDFEENCNYYYMMTESGTLYALMLSASNSGYSMDMSALASFDLELLGASDVAGGVYASMMYDTATNSLLISYTAGDVCTLYTINLKTGLLSKYGNLDSGYWPLVCLYQHERATDLILNIDPTEKTLSLSDSFTIETEVILGETGEVSFQSSDEAVATVTADGLVTAVGAGTAVITVTTIDTNAAGETLSATCTVKVKDNNGAVEGIMTDAASGASHFFSWKKGTLTTGAAIDSSLSNIVCGTVDTANNAVYLMSSSSRRISKVNPETGKIL